MTTERIFGDELETIVPVEQFTPSTPQIAQALDLEKYAHGEQLRKSGEPYFHHPIAVAQILISWGLGGDEDLICAALLHDVPEDCQEIDLQKIRSIFGDQVASIVDGVTKVDSQVAVDVDLETLHKVSSKSYLEPKVALVKLADRLHNMRTLWAVRPEKQIEKAQETLEVYAKLAQSLGLWTVKRELEDLSFMYLDPANYEQLKRDVDADSRLDGKFLGHMSSSLEQLLLEKDISGKVTTRINGLWSLYKKREAALLKGKTSSSKGIKDINDVVSFRVVTKSLQDCYTALAFIHQEFGEYVDFDRYDEFVGVNRRINGYSALQTTLNLPSGAVEIAIATEEMERFNKKGVASLLEKGETSLEDYTLKSIFSPTGKIMFLPKKATGVDYAYAISHSLGANARSLKINGEERPLTTVLANSSVVEIFTGESRRAPDPDYLHYCLPTTRAIIIDQLNLAETDELLFRGRQKAELILASRGLLRFEDLGFIVNELIYDYSREDIRDIYLMLGRGAIAESGLNIWLDQHGVTKAKLGISSIKIEGIDKPGVLSDISKSISENGGDIKGIDLKTDKGNFILLIIARGISSEGEKAIYQRLSNDNRFLNCLVV